MRAVLLTMMLGVPLFTLGAGSANAAWGISNHCSTTKWCWSQAEDNIHAYSIVGLEETRGENNVCNDGTVYQKIAAFPEAKQEHLDWPEERGDKPYIAIGQLFGDGYCDNAPHLYTAEINPTTGEYKSIVSGPPTWEHQFNMYAISDVAKNGAFVVYYRIPNESGVWTKLASWGGGWSALMYGENSGINLGTESAPGYEGAGETLWTDGSIEWPLKGGPGGNWTGSSYFAEYGNTCVQPLSGAGEAPGNAAYASCPL